MLIPQPTVPHRGFTRCRVIALAVLLCACGNDKEERPEPYVPPFADNLAACYQLADATPVGQEIHWQGQPAGCAAVGLQCPLPAAFDAICAGAVPYAECRSLRWALRCDAVSTDAGNAEAGAP